MVKSTRGGKRNSGASRNSQNVFETEGGRYTYWEENGEYYASFELKSPGGTYGPPDTSRYDKSLWEEELKEWRNSTNRKRSPIYETVETVNGHDIYRMKGTKGYYHVEVAPGEHRDFRTKKAARAFAESLR